MIHNMTIYARPLHEKLARLASTQVRGNRKAKADAWRVLRKRAPGPYRVKILGKDMGKILGGMSPNKRHSIMSEIEQLPSLQKQLQNSVRIERALLNTRSVSN